jgi:hypothetical protein
MCPMYLNNLSIPYIRNSIWDSYVTVVLIGEVILMIMAPTVTVNDLHAVNICLNKVLFIQK